MTDDKQARIAALAESFEPKGEAVDTTAEEQVIAAPQGEDVSEEAAASGGDEAPDKTGKRKGLDQRFSELTQKRKDAERLADEKAREADYWRQQAEQNKAKPEQPPAQVAKSDNRPKLEDFDFDADAHAEAVAEWKFKSLRERERAEESQRQEQEKAQTRVREFQTKVAEFQQQNPDYNEVVNANVPITKEMADLIMEADNAPDIAYYLGKNIEEAAQIASMSPTQAARAIGRLEAKLSAPASATPQSPPRSVTKAPDITPTVKGSAAVKKDTASMDFQDHLAAVREQTRR